MGPRWAMLARQFGKASKPQPKNMKMGQGRGMGDTLPYCTSIVLKESEYAIPDVWQGTADYCQDVDPPPFEQPSSLLERLVAEALDEEFSKRSSAECDHQADTSSGNQMDRHGAELA
eukprot:3047872-Amphidinium_carterae.1